MPRSDDRYVFVLVQIQGHVRVEFISFFPLRKLIAFYGNQSLFQFVNSLVVLLVLEHSTAERSVVCLLFYRPLNPPSVEIWLLTNL